MCSLYFNSNILGKDINCKITSQTIYLSLFGEEVAYLEGTLEEKVKKEESMWTIINDTSTPQIVITLEKIKSTWWSKGETFLLNLINFIFNFVS